MPSGPSLLNDSDSVQIAPLSVFSWMLMSIAMPSCGWIGPLHRVGLHDAAAGLVLEQVHRVRGVVPQQVVGPAARLAQRVHVRAAEEIGLHVHLLDVELARLDLLVHVLVAGIEAARVADHRDQAGLLLRLDDRLGRPPACRTAGSPPARACRPSGGDRLRGVHLRGRAQDHGVHVGTRQRLGEVRSSRARAVLAAPLPGPCPARGR